MTDARAKIYVLHENDEWTVHLTRRLEELHLPYELWHLDHGRIDLTETPPEGVFFSRMSASAHTRDHRYAPELTGAVLAWLEAYGRRVINGWRVLQLEVSKVNQYMAMKRHGIRAPHTVAAVGREDILQAADQFEGRPFITKHNRAGKGLGVQLFYSKAALKEYLDGSTYEPPVDGITLLQEYIQSPESYITRCEFIGGKFLYAVRVDTSEGFQLCPADACQIGDLFCPVGTEAPSRPKFQIIEGFADPILNQYEALLADCGIEVAGIEFIRDAQGEIYTYDINTNTNYNSDAEAAAGKYGMLAVAKFLGAELEKLQKVPSAAAQSAD
ncbi:MAG: alpha-L-glutamate ligase [Alicyclobacillus sp.]|nr:alpha-L-glutamate ligase [Alicyclobacillus sp.]